MNKHSITLDANIFIKLVHAESDSQKAIDLISYIAEKSIKIICPCEAIGETMGVCERLNLDKREMQSIFNDLMSFNMTLVNTTSSLINTAIEMTEYGNEKSGHPTFKDSLYHAVAINGNNLFITADKKHKIKAKKKYKNIVLLKDWETFLK